MKIGLLPFYIKLYDDSGLDVRENLKPFMQEIEEGLKSRGIDVQLGAVCTQKSEFEREIKSIEDNGCQALVTLHLAYSPSLESIDALLKTRLPIIVMDTTIEYSFGKSQTPSAILYNHGIHGVQDMCCMLRRYGKPFLIEAGHYAGSDIFERLIQAIKAGVVASSLQSARVGIIGKPFCGMGDFQVGFDELKEKIGIDVIEFNPADAHDLLWHASNELIVEELEQDRQQFIMSDVSEDTMVRSIRTAHAVRKWIEDLRLTAFTANFLDITPDTGLECMPFYEASKAMARGVGYAGEGDVLTAAFTGALMEAFPDTSFVEMFCPDWKGNTVFLSHMGEYNIRLSSERPYVSEMDFTYTNAKNPAVIYGCFRRGRAVFANLAPGADGRFTLIVSQVEMIDEYDNDSFQKTVRGWFRPVLPLERFLEAYSSAGGTHHGALCYDADMDVIKNAGKLMGFDVVEI